MLFNIHLKKILVSSFYFLASCPVSCTLSLVSSPLLAAVSFARKQSAAESGSIPLRGDINVCMVGDPACAKSQLLRAIARIVQRGVMATGQTSSAAGLTAAVVKVCMHSAYISM